METEKLKQLVLAKGKEIAPTVGTHEIYAGIVVTNWPSGIRTIDRIPDGAAAIPICILDEKIPASHHIWWIAAKLLDIPTEMLIKNLTELENDGN